jgi:Ricin-type beta-trefoil lectin domain-like
VPAHGRMFGRRARHEPHFRRHRRPTLGGRACAGLALVLLVAAVTALGVLAGRPDGGGVPQPVPIAEVPADNPRLGLVYQGLAPARHGTPCVGAYQVVAPDLCTHGPDGPLAGLDVHRDVAPVAASSPTPTLARQNIAAVPQDASLWPDAGAVAETKTTAADAPALVPDAPADTIRPDGVVCDGDGTGGKRVQVLYAYQTGTASRYSQYLASFRAWAAGVDAIFDTSAAQTGGGRHVRYVTTPDCEVAVTEVELPAGALDTVNATIAVLRSLGYQRADRKYLIFADANVYCGIGTFAGDDRPGAGNRSNTGPGYGRADAGCWSPVVVAHELAHNLGAVHNSAPNSSQAGHCVDGYDVMCQADPGAGARPDRLPCPNRADARLLDCNHDDYFNTNPKRGSYLATHWNVADSQFLVDDSAGPAAQQPSAPTGPAPVATPSAAAANGPAPGGPAGQPAAGGPAAGQPAAGQPAAGGPAAGGPAAGQPAADEPPGRDKAKQQGTGPDETRPGQPPAAPVERATAGPDTAAAPTSSDPAAAQAPAPLVPLQVEATASTAVRVAWRAAGIRTEYGVRVNGVLVGSTTATAGRVIGLHPDTTYRLQVVTASGPYTGTATARTPAAPGAPSGKWFTLGNALTGGVATLYASRAGAGAPLVLQPDTGAANQDWQLQSAGDGSYLLWSRATGKCVVPRGGQAVPGAPLVQQRCPSLPAAGQRWRVTRTAYGFSLTALDAAGPLVVGVGVDRFCGDRLLVLQRPALVRHQSWTAQ